MPRPAASAVAATATPATAIACDLGKRNAAAATGGNMKRKPGPSGYTATRTAAAPIITSTISTLARVAAGGMRSNDNRAAMYPAKASVTARPFPVKPGAGRAQTSP